MPKILIIDDREDNLTSIKTLIKTYRPDYKTVTALSGEGGIKLARTEKPDTILLYINMIKMDGFEICRQLKQDKELKHIPIIFLTDVKTSSQDRIKGLKLGGDAYLTEPVDSGELIAQLSVMLRIKEAEDKLRSEKANLGEFVEARMKDLSETNKKLQLEITERKKKELELLESKLKLSEAQRIAKMGFLSWNLKTNEIELSDEVIKLYGLDPETKRITPDFISNIVYFEDLEFVQNNLRMAVKGEKEYNIDHRIIRPNGEVIWVHSQAELICDDDGNAVSLIGTIIDITERKQAEERIARFSRIFEDSLNEIYLFESDTLKFTVVNKAAQQNLGYSIEELQNLTPIDIKPEFSTESFIKLVAPLRKGEKKKIVFRTVHKRKNQSLYDVEVHLQLMNLVQKPLFAAIILDITERKQAEESLKKSEENLRTTLNSIGDAVISTDVNGNIIHINPIAEKLTGWKEKDALDKPLGKIFKIINEETRKKVGNPVERVLQKGVVIGLANHTLLISKQGEEIPIADSGAPIRNEDGEITGVVLVFRDQTKEREAQRKLKESEQWNKEIFEGSLDAIFIVDSNTHIVDVNEAATSLTGYSNDELLKMSISDLHKKGDLEAYNKFFKRIMGGESITNEAKIFRKDGTKVDAEFSNKRIIIGNVAYMHTIARDITERKQAEEKIKQKNKQLLLLSKASTEINKVLDIKIILQQLVKIVIELTGSSSGAAALYEDDKMVFKTYNDKGKITPINFKFEKGQGVSGWVLKTKEPYITNDAKNDKHVIQKIREAFNFHKLINVPIFNKEGELLGCFTIHKTKEGRPYNKNDIEILQGLAANTSVAIENAQMILERKKAEKMLSAERDKFSYILNSLPIGVSVLDSDDKYIFINSVSLKIDCYPDETQNLIGNNVKCNHPKNILPVIDKLINDFKSGKITHHFREAKRGKRTVQISYHALHNHEGKYTGIIRLVSDITEKKKSELLLKESEKKYRELFEKSDDAILIIENNKFVDCNDSTVKMLRYKNKEELLNTHPSALSPEFQPDGRRSFEKAEEIMRIAFQKGSHRFEWDHKKADGEVFPVEVLLTAVTSNTLHVVWRDITKRKKAEMELRESRQRLSSHLDNTPLGAIFLDVDFKVTDWNKSAEEIFGYSKEEVLGKHVNELIVPKELQDKIDEVFNHLLTQTGGERSTNENITKNGKRILCDWYNVAVTDLNGKITGVASLVDDITEQKEARLALKKSEKHYRDLFNSINDLICIHDLEGNILSMNPAAEKNLDYKTSEILNRNLYELLAPEIKNLFKDYLTTIKKEGRAKGFMIILTRTGEKRIWEYNNSLVKIDNEEEFISGIARDVTEAKKAEKELKALNEFNESLIETIPFGFDIVDLEGNILFMNNLLKDALGIKNPKGKCWEFYKDDGKQCIECPLKDEMKLSGTNISEVQGIFGGREYEITHTFMNYKNQKAMLELFRDITESKKAQQEILKLSRGIEQSPAMVVITDFKGIIEYVNPKVEVVTGYSKEELIGKNTRIFRSGKTPKKTYEKLRKTILNGEIWEGIVLNKRKNGEEYWESERISPILNNKGKIINYISIKEDITEQIKARDELIEAKEKAEKSEKLKGEFLAQMSHEIRSPIHTILSFTQLLESELNDKIEGELRESFTAIRNAGQRVVRTIDLILNMSQIQTNSLETHFRNINLTKEILEPLYQEYYQTAKARGLKLEFIKDTDDVNVEGDEYTLNQIIANLLNNAIKYTEKGEITLRVFRTETNLLAVEVTDTGIGISEEYLPKIFDSFTQEEQGYTRQYDGNGLGLALVKKYCQINNADIFVESEKWKGSTFRVVF